MASTEVATSSLPAAALDLGQGRPMPNDDHFIYKVSAEDSQGRFALLQGGLAPRMLIPPHVHSRFEEVAAMRGGWAGALDAISELAARYGQQWVQTDWLAGVITRFKLRA